MTVGEYKGSKLEGGGGCVTVWWICGGGTLSTSFCGLGIECGDLLCLGRQNLFPICETGAARSWPDVRMECVRSMWLYASEGLMRSLKRCAALGGWVGGGN
jgi:hypothetical protein